MSTALAESRYPSGTGMVAGYALGFLVSVLAWVVSAEVTFGLILFVATGTALGVALEQSMDTRPPTGRERRLALILATAGLVVGFLVFAYVVLYA